MTETSAPTRSALSDRDRPLLGIALMLGFCAVIPLGDAVAKLLSTRIPVGQIVFVRFAAQAVLLAPVALAMGISLRLPRRILPLVVLRTLLQMGGITAMFMALRFLPLADAVAIAFVMPFIMLLLGKYVLNEEVGLRRLLACIVGFIGTLLVIQPSFAEVGANALWPLAVAVIFALFMLVTRKIARDTDPIAIQAVSGAIASVLMLGLFTLGYGLSISELAVTLPAAPEARLLALAGCPRDIGPSDDDMVAALCADQHAGFDAIPRNSGGGSGRLAVLCGTPGPDRLQWHRADHGCGALRRDARAAGQPSPCDRPEQTGSARIA